MTSFFAYFSHPVGNDGVFLLPENVNIFAKIYQKTARVINDILLIITNVTNL